MQPKKMRKPEAQDMAMEMRTNRKTLREIAEATGWSKSTVGGWLKKKSEEIECACICGNTFFAGDDWARSKCDECLEVATAEADDECLEVATAEAEQCHNCNSPNVALDFFRPTCDPCADIHGVKVRAKKRGLGPVKANAGSATKSAAGKIAISHDERERLAEAAELIEASRWTDRACSIGNATPAATWEKSVNRTPIHTTWDVATIQKKPSVGRFFYIVNRAAWTCREIFS